MAVKKLGRRARVSVQKIIRHNSKAKQPEKPTSKVVVKDRKTLLIAQEIKFARLLASNDKRVRDKVLKNLKKWLTVRSNSSFAFTEADFMRLWKGLFYCMWMSDKPLVQEELAESLSNIVHCFNTLDVFLLYTRCAWRTLATEWYGIDQYRIDKFLMLVRRIFRQTFNMCKCRDWNEEWVMGMADLLKKQILEPQINLGFNMHVIELYLEELAKVSRGNIPKEIVTILIKPFLSCFSMTVKRPLLGHVKRYIFRYLILQSNVGIDYMEKYNAWKQAGFPCGDIEVMNRVEVNSDEDMEVCDEEEQNDEEKNKEDTEKPLDPRAGRVDVELPQIPFDPEVMITLLKEYKMDPSVPRKSQKQIAILIPEFKEVAAGYMPFTVKRMRVPEFDRQGMCPRKGARRLMEFEEELYSDTVRGKRRRKKNGHAVDYDDEDYDEYEHEDGYDDFQTDIEPERMNAEDDLSKDKQNVEDTTDQSADMTSSKCDSVVKNLKNKLKKKKVNAYADGNVNLEKSEKQSISKLMSIGASNKVKKCKTLQDSNGSEATLETAPKLKKSGQIEVHDNWDVSDNVAPPKPTKPIRDKGSKVGASNSVKEDTKNSNNQIGNQAMWLTSVLTKLEEMNNKAARNSKESSKQMTEQRTEQGSKKRVKIVLQRNTAQNTSEYIRQIRQSPAIPFDANKKPLASALKANAIPSPVNPFYKRKFK